MCVTRHLRKTDSPQRKCSSPPRGPEGMVVLNQVTNARLGTLVEVGIPKPNESQLQKITGPSTTPAVAWPAETELTGYLSLPSKVRRDVSSDARLSARIDVVCCSHFRFVCFAVLFCFGGIFLVPTAFRKTVLLVWSQSFPGPCHGSKLHVALMINVSASWTG